MPRKRNSQNKSNKKKSSLANNQKEVNNLSEQDLNGEQIKEIVKDMQENPNLKDGVKQSNQSEVEDKVENNLIDRFDNAYNRESLENSKALNETKTNDKPDSIIMGDSISKQKHQSEDPKIKKGNINQITDDKQKEQQEIINSKDNGIQIENKDVIEEAKEKVSNDQNSKIKKEKEGNRDSNINFEEKQEKLDDNDKSIKLEKTSKQFVEEKTKELFNLLDFSCDHQNIEKLKEDLGIFFSKEKMDDLLQSISLNINQETNSKDRIKEFLIKFTESKKIILKNNENLQKFISIFFKHIKGFIEKHNYSNQENKIYDKIEDDFRVRTFEDKKINEFKNQEKDCCIDIFNYKESEEKYKGEKTIVEEDNKKYKKRHGFGYYSNSKEKISYYGMFDNDKYKKGFLNCQSNSFFNGEFSSENEIFKGLYTKNDDVSNSNYIMIGETNVKEKTFDGIFIKSQEELIRVYYGSLKNQLKNSKNAILIDIKPSDFKEDKKKHDFNLYFGDFENDQPSISDNNNDFFIYENESLSRITGSEKKITCMFSIDEDLISQGDLLGKSLNGRALLLDSQSKIYYFGDMANGKYRGKGNLLSYDQENNPSKIIYVTGDFEENQIKNAEIYDYEKKDSDETFISIENAILSNQLELNYGKIYFENNEYYEGAFKDHQRHGKGKYVYQDGSYYEGEWKNDKKDGYGIYVDSQKREFKGTWAEDELRKMD